jgi:hypothetical protein
MELYWQTRRRHQSSEGARWIIKLNVERKNEKQSKKLIGICSSWPTSVWSASSHNEMFGTKTWPQRLAVTSSGGSKVEQDSRIIGQQHAGKNGNQCECSTQSGMNQITSDRENGSLTAPKMKIFQQSIFHCWKMEKWTGKREEKIRDQDVKKGEEYRTYHLWKPEVGKSMEPLPQYLGLTTVKKLLAEKIGQKEVKLILCSGKGKTSESEIHTWIRCEPDAGTFSASFHDSICRENSSFRENGCKMVIKKLGLPTCEFHARWKKI